MSRAGMLPRLPGGEDLGNFPKGTGSQSPIYWFRLGVHYPVLEEGPEQRMRGGVTRALTVTQCFAFG